LLKVSLFLFEKHRLAEKSRKRKMNENQHDLISTNSVIFSDEQKHFIAQEAYFHIFPLKYEEKGNSKKCPVRTSRKNKK